MSLLQEAMEKCVVMDKITTNDPYSGAPVPVWKDGATFEAAITYDSSMQARTAIAQGVTSLYTITTSKAINLQYHDVLRRLSDGKIFRVTSDGDDDKTPMSAGLNMRQVSAEEYRPAGDGGEGG